MWHVLLVGLGGCLGSIARYKLSGFVLHHSADWRFPLGTFAVNVVGCLIAGLLAGLIERQHWFSADTRIFLFSGFLGGFTTFSAFGVDTMFLLRRGEFLVAFGYVAFSVLCALAALWLAMKLVPHSYGD
ncbi:MAG TPA: fluoride efflux transporter CrcB [Pirellulales bacterium]|jgi:CrcB protein